MARGKAALDALEQLLGGAVRRMDPGDVAPSPAAQRQALESLAPAADDWGWRGGKPGEITGGEYMRALKKAENAAEDAVEEAGFPRGYTQDVDAENIYYTVLDDNMVEMNEKFAKQLKRRQKRLGLREWETDPNETGELATVAARFEAMEDAGIPRKWTGKLFRLPQITTRGQYEIEELSSAMKTMSPEERDLVPEIGTMLYTLSPTTTATGVKSVRDMVEVVKAWPNLTDDQKAMFKILFSDTGEDAPSVIKAVRNI